MNDQQWDEVLAREAFDVEREIVEPAARRSQGSWLLDCVRDERGPRAKLSMFARNLIAAAEALEDAARKLRKRASAATKRADSYKVK